MSAASLVPPTLDLDVPGGDSDVPPITFESEESAARYLQRKWRSREVRKLLASFPSIEQLKSIYLDKKAQAAGAAGSRWYSSFALAAREHVRMSMLK